MPIPERCFESRMYAARVLNLDISYMGFEAGGCRGHLVTALKTITDHASLLDSEPDFTFTSHMRNTRRYWIEIKDAKGSIVFATAADWDGHNRRAAVAKMQRLDGVLEPPSFPSRCSGQDVATNIDVERMAASFAIATSAKKKPRH